jgi:hypothetical protein
MIMSTLELGCSSLLFGGIFSVAVKSTDGNNATRQRQCDIPLFSHTVVAKLLFTIFIIYWGHGPWLHLKCSKMRRRDSVKFFSSVFFFSFLGCSFQQQ